VPAVSIRCGKAQQSPRRLHPLVGLRDAYARAQREGLKHADNVQLSFADKNHEQPLLMWSFTGQHTREDSQAIHIDAGTGAYIDEDRINDLSRAARAAQLEARLQDVKRAAAALRASAAGGSGMGGSSGSASGGSSSGSNNAQACSNRNGTMSYGNCEVYNGGGYTRIDPETGKEVIH
jgi:hypothetical protein